MSSAWTTTQQQSSSSSNPRMGTAEMILAAIGALIGFAIGYFTVWIPSNIADTHEGFGYGVIGLLWALLISAFWAFVGGALGWQLSGRSFSTPNFVRKLPGTAIAATKWGWSHRSGGKSILKSVKKLVRPVWILFWLSLGLYVGMTNRHWVDAVANDVFRFALKFILVLICLGVGYLIAAWIWNFAKGLVTKVNPPPTATTMPTTASSTSTAQQSTTSP